MKKKLCKYILYILANKVLYILPYSVIRKKENMTISLTFRNHHCVIPSFFFFAGCQCSLLSITFRPRVVTTCTCRFININYILGASIIKYITWYSVSWIEKIFFGWNFCLYTWITNLAALKYLVKWRLV